jgi:hypothetical protein
LDADIVTLQETILTDGFDQDAGEAFDSVRLWTGRTPPGVM